MKISESKIIVTGAGNGIGKQLCLNLSSLGSTVIGIDKSEKDLTYFKEENSNIKTKVCDISDGKYVEEIISSIFKEDKDINVVINNAGVMFSQPLVKIEKGEVVIHDFSEWEKVISTNLSGYFYVTSSSVKHMIDNRTKGLIINMSSISARGNAGQSAYAASKSGVEALTKTWAKELGPLGFRSVAIAPGFIDTQGTHLAIDEKIINDWIKQVPLRRLGKTDEVIKAIIMCIENDFMNGKVLSLDGGLIF